MTVSPDNPHCELMETCSFYWNCQNHPETVKRQLINRFCNSEKNSERCERIRYLREKCESPSPGLTPEGDTLLVYHNHPA